MITIQCREQRIVNTDPQRRCYDGCNFSEALVWTQWRDIEYVTEEKKDTRLKFWKELNDYAVSQRGKSAKSEFRLVEQSHE